MQRKEINNVITIFFARVFLFLLGWPRRNTNLQLCFVLCINIWTMRGKVNLGTKRKKSAAERNVKRTKNGRHRRKQIKAACQWESHFYQICYGPNPVQWPPLRMKPIFIFIAAVNLSTAQAPFHSEHIPSLPIQSRQIKEAPPPPKSPHSHRPIHFVNVCRCRICCMLLTQLPPLAPPKLGSFRLSFYSNCWPPPRILPTTASHLCLALHKCTNDET